MFSDIIQIGQRIHCILHGGKDGIVTAIHGQQQPQSCRELGGIGVTGGNATLDIIWDNGTQSLQIPESLARSSVQWRISLEVATAADIAHAELYLAEATTQRTLEQARQRAAFTAEQARLREAYPQLLTKEQEPGEPQRATRNIRILLKAAWPKVKFSVRRSSYATLDVSWTDGPTQRRVDDLLGKFEAGHFDGMTDCYESRETPWNSLFGNCNYLFTGRSNSAEMTQRAIDLLWAALPNVRELAKPTPDTVWQGHIPVPHLPDTTVEALVRAILNALDATTGGLADTPDTGRHSWLVGQVRNHLQQQAPANPD